MSVIVKYDDWGRMGNRMFQYAFGYLLSKDRGDEFFAKELPNFNIEKTPNYEIACNLNPNQVFFTRSCGNNYVDYELLKDVNKNKTIVVDSFLQKSKYYINHKNDLKNVFNIQTRAAINNEALVMHIRETDYTQINAFLGYDFYKKAIEITRFKNIIIVTDNSNCETVKKLVRDGCKLWTEGYVDKFSPVSDNRAMNDFYALLYSENILISQSSFSWWAAFLGEHKNIFLPQSDNIGIWKNTPAKDDIDLWFDFGNTKRIVI